MHQRPLITLGGGLMLAVVLPARMYDPPSLLLFLALRWISL